MRGGALDVWDSAGNIESDTATNDDGLELSCLSGLKEKLAKAKANLKERKAQKQHTQAKNEAAARATLERMLDLHGLEDVQTAFAMLRLGVMSKGSNAEEALEMIREACDLMEKKTGRHSIQSMRAKLILAEELMQRPLATGAPAEGESLVRECQEDLQVLVQSQGVLKEAVRLLWAARERLLIFLQGQGRLADLSVALSEMMLNDGMVPDDLARKGQAPHQWFNEQRAKVKKMETSDDDNDDEEEEA
jgi:hypothetical protein